MKRTNYVLFIFSVFVFTLSSSLKATDNSVYVYLGQEASNISQVIECIKNIDPDNNSPLNNLFVHIKNGFLFEEYEKMLEVLEYAELFLQHNTTLSSEQLHALIFDFEIVMRQFFNGELTIDTLQEDIIRASHLRTLVVNENMDVLGESSFHKHMKTKEGIHVLGKLKVGKNAKFKNNVIIDGTLSVGDVAIASCLDSLCVTNLSVVNGSISGTLSVNDLVAPNFALPCNIIVGCNISMSDSIDVDHGNIIKNGVPFIHNFGTDNTFVGDNAGNFTQFGIENSAFGSAALQNNVDGSWNSAFGYNALNASTTGFSNVAVGANALQNNISGSGNTAIGYNALNGNTTGINNVAIGSNTLLTNEGNGNVAIGATSLILNEAGYQNVAVGTFAMGGNTTGSYNVAMGTSALSGNTAGNYNVAIGFGALESNMVDGNTAVGMNALLANTTGANNTAVGNSALQSNTIGFANTAVGLNALHSNTTGINNTALGQSALTANTIGAENTAVGVQALAANTTGYNNVAVGFQSLYFNTTGVNNTAIGQGALANNIIDASNVAVGWLALGQLASGSVNIAMGAQAGYSLTAGTRNIYIGADAAAAAESDTIRIGTSQTATYVAGIYGATYGITNAPVIVDNTGKLGTTLSTRKVKHNIEDMNDLSAEIWNLRPVIFAYNNDVSETMQYGLIAEEVDAIFPGIVVRDADGQPLTVQYHVLPVLLLNEMQKQQTRLAIIEERLAYLEARL